MKRTILGAVAGLLFASGSALANTDYWFSGQMCQGVYQTDRDQLVYNSYGVTQDEELVDHAVVCPVGGNNSTTVDMDQATIRFIDQTDDGCLSCLIRIRNQTQTTYTGSTLYSSNNTGGSTSCTASNEGNGYLEWTTTELPNSGSSISSVASYAFECTIPTKHVIDQAAEANTHILAYQVQQVSP